jgi:hypothetical protein
VEDIAQSVADVVERATHFLADFFSTATPIVTAAPCVLPRLTQTAPNFLASAFHFPPHFLPNPS